MARTAVPTTALAHSAGVLQGAGVALDPANGHNIPGPTVSGQTVVLDIDSTFAGAKTFTIKSGSRPQSANGDLVISLNAQRELVILDSAAYAQADGSFNIDVQAGATGTIRALYLPHH